MLRYSFLCIAILYSHVVLAWNGNFHKVIAQIAYHHLTPEGRALSVKYDELFEVHYGLRRSFVSGASWADEIKRDGNTAYNNWHFVNFPIEPNKFHRVLQNDDNLLWAIHHVSQGLESKSTADKTRSFNYHFFTHLVGDAHQPLHCATRETGRGTKGDLGGTLFPVKSPYAKNLHSLWDNGLGLYWQAKPYRWSARKIERVSLAIERQYPRFKMIRQIRDTNPTHWADESLKIAQNFTYHAAYGQRPTEEYMLQGREIVKARLALAGYRLAYLFNHLANQMSSSRTG